MHKFILITVISTLIAGSALADPPKKKPNYPPPEESTTVGALGAPHRDSASAAKGPSTPPPVTAAPEIPKVEAEPESLTAVPRESVFGDQPVGGGGTNVAARLPTPPASGFLVEHPMISGLVAGLIGTDLGSKLYGGAMMGDRTAADIGYGVRIALILLLALLLFRLIGNRVSKTDDLPIRSDRGRRVEPSFGAVEPVGDGRREPHFGKRD